MTASVEEAGGLLGPDPDAGVVEDVKQECRTSFSSETAAEVSRGGRVGNAPGTRGVEKDLVISPQLDVLEAGAFAKGVVGEVQHMVGFMEGEVEFEQLQPLVDGVNEAELADQGMNGSDAAVSESRVRSAIS